MKFHSHGSGMDGLRKMIAYLEAHPDEKHVVCQFDAVAGGDGLVIEGREQVGMFVAMLREKLREWQNGLN